MNTNERTILEMIITRLERGESTRGLINLLHDTTAQALPRDLQLSAINSGNRQQIIKDCKNLLKNGEPSQ